jgi:hypothetical protein
LAKALLGGVLELAATWNGTTAYSSLVAGQYTHPTLSVTESHVQVTAAAGTYSLLGLYVATNASGTGTFRFRVAGSNGNQSVSIGSGATGWMQDASDTDVVTAGQLVANQLTVSANNFTFGCWNTTFDNGGSTATTFYGCGALDRGANTWQGVFAGMGSWIGENGNGNEGDSSSALNISGEGPVQQTVRAAGTLSNLAIYASSGTQTWTLRHNTANGNESAGGSTGLQQDTSHTDTLASGDLIDFSVSNASGAVANAFVEFASSSAKAELFSGMNGASTVFDSATVFFEPFTGYIGNETAYQTEANSQQKFTFGATTSNFRYVFGAGGSGSAITINLRKNGSNGNQSVSIALPLGLYEDASDTDNFSSGDLGGAKFTQTGGLANTQISQGALTLGPLVANASASGALGANLTIGDMTASAAGTSNVTATGALGANLTIGSMTATAAVLNPMIMPKAIAYAITGIDGAELMPKSVAHAIIGVPNDTTPSMADAKSVAYAIIGPPPPRRPAQVRVQWNR